MKRDSYPFRDLFTMDGLLLVERSKYWFRGFLLLEDFDVG